MASITLHIGGDLRSSPLRYVGGKEITLTLSSINLLSFNVLKEAISNSGSEGELLSIFYLMSGVSMAAGLTPVEDDEDVTKLVAAWSVEEKIDVYAILEPLGGFDTEQVVDGQPELTAGGDKDKNVVVVSENEQSEQTAVGENEQPDQNVGGGTVEPEHTVGGENEPTGGEGLEQPEDDGFDVDEPNEEDDEFLEGVDYGSDREDEERETFIVKAKEYVNMAVTRVAQDNDYVGADHENYDEMNDSDGLDGDDERNWSLSGNEGNRGGSDSDGNTENVEPHLWKKSQNVYYDEDHPSLQLHMIFSRPAEFKKAIIQDSIIRNAPFEFVKNDTTRVRAQCMTKGCAWMIFASYEKNTGEFQVKMYVPDHTCAKSYNNPRIDQHYLADRFFSLIRAAPSLKLNEFRRIVKEQMNLNIGVMKASRVRSLCKKKMVGNYNDEFIRLWNYALEIGRSNPGSTVRIHSVEIVDGESRVFKRIYVCFDALRRGFKDYCRPFIGIDGCFLKGMLKGELLVAVVRDGNNQMWAFAWAIVERENTESWRWFMELLKADVGTENGSGYTLMSDQQKGLKKAVAELWPLSQHRYCARHIYANWRPRFPGRENQKLFWSVAKSTTKYDFQKNMAKLVPEARAGLLRIDPSHWCKAFFQTVSNCDVVDNNTTEAFNASAVDARHMSIISCLETLRRDAQRRIIKKKEDCEKWQTDLSPRIRALLGDYKDWSRNCYVEYADRDVFEVSEHGDYYVVKLQERTCTCRVWDLSGIPCKHVIACLNGDESRIFQHVVNWYKRDTYVKLYELNVHLMVGNKHWPTSSLTPLLPPPPKELVTGPAQAKRRPELDEGSSNTKASRKGRVMRCTKCNGEGHNSRSKKCPLYVAPTVPVPTVPVLTVPVPTVPAKKRASRLPVVQRSNTVQPDDTVKPTVSVQRGDTVQPANLVRWMPSYLRQVTSGSQVSSGSQLNTSQRSNNVHQGTSSSRITTVQWFTSGSQITHDVSPRKRATTSLDNIEQEYMEYQNRKKKAKVGVPNTQESRI